LVQGKQLDGRFAILRGFFVSSWLHLHFRVAAVIIVAIAALAVAFPRSGRVIIVCDD
jgi:hypothetical protein